MTSLRLCCVLTEMQKTEYMVFAGRQYFLGDKCQVTPMEAWPAAALRPSASSRNQITPDETSLPSSHQVDEQGRVGGGGATALVWAGAAPPERKVLLPC